MAPLKSLESLATGQNSVNAALNPTVEDEQFNGSGNRSHLNQISYSSSRSSLEDLELETRALTEPLPTNQLVFMITIYLNDTCLHLINQLSVSYVILCRHIRIITCMLSRNGLQRIKYCIHGVRCWDIVRGSQCIPDLVSRHYKQDKSGYERGYKL
jgi:hypothetical protein